MIVVNNLKIEDIIYFAGIVDGEGCIYAQHYKIGNRISATLVVGNTFKQLINWIQHHISVGTLSCVDRKDCPNSKPIYIWICSRPDIEQVLSLILPYLIIKKKQAIIVLKIRKQMRNRDKSKRNLSNKEIEDRNKWVEEIRLLNKRGRL